MKLFFYLFLSVCLSGLFGIVTTPRKKKTPFQRDRKSFILMCNLLQRQFKSVTCHLFIALILNGTIRKKLLSEIYTEFMTSPGV